VDCPADELSGPETECRASAGVCDPEEYCTGTGVDCPADELSGPDTECRASAGVCDPEEYCTGSDLDCPADVLSGPDTECRASAGVCDPEEYCTGSDVDCPADVLSGPDTECRASAGVCDPAESCTGSDVGCPDDLLYGSETECRASAGVCDVAESCTGSDVDCPADTLLGPETECRPAIDDQCDIAEVCPGDSPACPPDETVPDGTECDDGEECTEPDECLAGECVSEPVPDTVNLSIELADVNIEVTRCIRFVLDDCAETFDVNLTFVDHDSDSGTPVRFEGTLDAADGVPCGAWTTMCAKDEQHTLWATTGLSLVDGAYNADSVLSLVGGDTDNNSAVDINDVTWFLGQFGQLAAAGSCPWDGTRDADFSNNGAVMSEDYTFFSTYWLAISSCDCAMTMGSPDPGGFGNLSNADLAVALNARELPTEVAKNADLNADGVIDYRDVQIFEQQNGLPDTLSEVMRMSSAQPAPTALDRKW
jgi:hypothetical protein